MSEPTHMRTETPFIYDTASINGAMRNLGGDLMNVIAAMMSGTFFFGQSATGGGVLAGFEADTNPSTMAIDIEKGVAIVKGTGVAPLPDGQSVYELYFLDTNTTVVLTAGSVLQRTDFITLTTATADKDSRLMPRKGSTAANVNVKRGFVTAVNVIEGTPGAGDPVLPAGHLLLYRVSIGSFVSDSDSVSIFNHMKRANTATSRVDPIQFVNNELGVPPFDFNAIEVNWGDLSLKDVLLKWGVKHWPGASRIADPVYPLEQEGEFFYMMAPGDPDVREWTKSVAFQGAGLSVDSNNLKWEHNDRGLRLTADVGAGSGVATAYVGVEAPIRACRFKSASVMLDSSSGGWSAGNVTVSLKRGSKTLGSIDTLASVTIPLSSVIPPYTVYTLSGGTTPVIQPDDYLFFVVAASGDAGAAVTYFPGGSVTFQDGQKD